MNKCQKFNKKAKELMPAYYGFLRITEEVDSYDEFGDILNNREGEYIAGMAAVIIAILKMENMSGLYS